MIPTLCYTPDASPAPDVVPVDLNRLLLSKMLIQANSGGGKSWALRSLLEQTHGQVQQIVLDPEGEFSTLREKFPYLLAGAGEGADVPLSVEGAPLLCRKIMELRVSTIIDLAEIEPEDRLLFVRRFLDELMRLPREFWRPLMVAIDEAQVFCPTPGSGETDALPAVISLCARGRKRGFCAILAVQRITTLHATAKAELLNRVIGRTGLDIDVKRAGDDLGFDKARREALKRLKPGQFFVYGPAVSDVVTLAQVAPVVTTHPSPGTIAPPAPPPPESIRALIEQLQGLPEQAKAEATTIEQLKEQIELLQSAANLARGNKQVVEVPVEKIKIVQRSVPILTEGDLSRLAAIEERFTSRVDEALAEATMTIKAAAQDAAEDTQRLKVEVIAVTEQGRAQMASETPPVALPATPEQATAAPTPQAANPIPAKPKVAPHPARSRSPEQRILDALATYESFGQVEVERVAVAALAGYKMGGHVNNTVGSLITQGKIRVPRQGVIALTEKGRALAQAKKYHTVQDVHQAWRDLLNGPQEKVLNYLLDIYPRGVTRAALSQQVGISGGHFNNTVGSLKTLKAIVAPPRGEAKASPLLFPPGLKQ